MEITVTIPDELANHILTKGSDPSRDLLEAVAVQAYREQRLGATELRGLLGMSRYELDGFLKARNVWIEDTLEDHDRARIVMEQALKEEEMLLQKRTA